MVCRATTFHDSKVTIGVTSVLLGVCLFGISQSVFADEITTENTPKEAVINQNTSSELDAIEITEGFSRVDDITSESGIVVVSDVTSESLKIIKPSEVGEISQDTSDGTTTYAEEMNVEIQAEPIVVEASAEYTESVTTTISESSEVKILDEENKEFDREPKNIESMDSSALLEVKSELTNEMESSATGKSVIDDVATIEHLLEQDKNLPVATRATTSVGQVIGGDYPASWKKRPNEYDTWGYNKSTCTSFVAHRLHAVNKFEIPREMGDAGQWGHSARRLGYRVDNTPAVGSVAWTTNGEYGHVAWVASVSGNTVTVEEYNLGWDYSHHVRTQPISAYTGFIHFKDLNGSNSSGSSGGQIGSVTSLPQSGTYRFTSRKGVKSEPKISSADVAYYDSGETVNYDKSLVADNYEWISYISYSGARRYIAINQLIQPVSPIVKGTINVQNKNDQLGTFDVVISNVSSNSGLKEVQVPIWSAHGGQDDIIWYKATKQANGDYKTSVSISNHKNNRGEYIIHLYYVIDNGKQVGVGGTKTIVQEPSNINTAVPTGHISIVNKNDQNGTFDIIISNVISPRGLKEVKVPTWSSQGGQDDIIWYVAHKQNNGTYKVSVKASDHKNSLVEYNIHLYYVQNNGEIVGVGGTTTYVKSVVKPPIPERGTYTFSNRASIKAEPKISSPEIAYYNAGDSVNYDRVLLAEGRYWISYISYSGNRRYINIT